MLYELKAKGKSIRAIARETGHSRNTVRKYLRAEGIPEKNRILEEVQNLIHTKTLSL
ncbi:MAG: ISChy4, transposase [Caldanaerobacter subterraneus]|jgi:predicted transcriptional regulator|uniref:helix-turn-helix domain-containing protein n=1 Tax=Caldanaerobacter subterraneus TaxID=911092 RepID=UPI00030739C1|nr:helix-turn-helix domain-containing protein [Caldanaerobacter subterraneus]KUK08028.1 MAG: ISChy4, transposase [Caldanaerobacter subterraneus]